jgi:hypothetical protein
LAETEGAGHDQYPIECDHLNNLNIKRATADMIEGSEAFERFPRSGEEDAIGSEKCHSEPVQQKEEKTGIPQASLRPWKLFLHRGPSFPRFTIPHLVRQPFVVVTTSTVPVI